MKKLVAPLMLAALLISACDRKADAPKEDDASAGNSASNTAAPAPGGAKEGDAGLERSIPDEITVEQLQGSWKVEAILALDRTRKTASRKVKEPMEGAIVDIYPEQLRWSYMPQKSEGSDDFCEEPVSGIIIQKAAREQADQFFAPALELLKIDPAKTGNPHEWMCAGGGQWGLSESSGALFLPLGVDEGLMGWHDGRILRMKRMARATPKSDVKAEDVIVDREE